LGALKHRFSLPLLRATASLPADDKSIDKRVYRPMDETVRHFLNPAHFSALLRSHSTTFFTGVPDSLLKDFCAYVTDNVSPSNHVIAANEGTAVALAAGHHLATGKVACVYLQNSGLGNTVNPLLSLCSPKVYSIPALLLIGWRGEPGKKDEPQHILQGSLTPGLLEEMKIPHDILPDYAEGAFEVLDKAYKHMETEKGPYALLVRKDTFEKYDLKSVQRVFQGDSMLHREEILERIISVFPTEPLVTTTGFTSREMFELRVAAGQSHEQDFLTVGSMGHCSSIALGIALSRHPDKQVLCVDGDGAAIMHLGGFATAGLSGMKNFKHILINNAIHDSVGGQPTGAKDIDFPAIARACGYRTAMSVSTIEEIEGALPKLREEDGPVFLEIRALPGARADLGRPTTTTVENKQSFMSMLSRA
jgi:phosphonopyruvate decarboxylase